MGVVNCLVTVNGSKKYSIGDDWTIQELFDRELGGTPTKKLDISLNGVHIDHDELDSTELSDGDAITYETRRYDSGKGNVR